MKNHKGMKMADVKKTQKPSVPDVGKDKNAPKKDAAATKEKTGHEGHDMSGKGKASKK